MSEDVCKVGVNVKDWRKPYFNESEPYILEENLPTKDPFMLFDIWFKDAASKEDLSYEEVNAVCLSTVSNNRPKSRMVLMKEYDQYGYCFYTNYKSAKGKQIDLNPNGALLFYWPKIDRQIRIEGTLEKLPASAADEYWSVRPLKSRIGSRLSEQSQVIPNRQYLMDKKKELEELAEKLGPEAITRPEHWGGYRLIPDYFEFWQGQSDRIHDRIVFELKPDKKEWLIKRLSP